MASQSLKQQVLEILDGLPEETTLEEAIAALERSQDPTRDPVYDAWLAKEIEQTLAQVESGGMALIPHEEVVLQMEALKRELLARGAPPRRSAC